MKNSLRKPEPSPPAHLRPETVAWWSSVVAEYELEPHHIRLLTSAAEAWDRATEARELLAVEGIVMADRFGQPKPHPACIIERDSKSLFARMLRELGLDLEQPGGASKHQTRPPARPGNSRLKSAKG